MVTNQMTHEAAMAVSIIDQIEGKDVQSVQMKRNKIVISQNNRIIAQWTGETWVLGTILKSVLPVYEDNCIHVINACTRLYRRSVEYKESLAKDATIAHSLRIIRYEMNEKGLNSMIFSGSLMNNWSPSVSYVLSRKEVKGEITKNTKELFQLFKVSKPTGNMEKAYYGFNTSLIGWVDVKSNKVTMSSAFNSYIDKWSLKGTKEIAKDDVLRQIAEFNNTKKR